MDTGARQPLKMGQSIGKKFNGIKNKVPKNTVETPKRKRSTEEDMLESSEDEAYGLGPERSGLCFLISLGLGLAISLFRFPIPDSPPCVYRCSIHFIYLRSFNKIQFLQ